MFEEYYQLSKTPFSRDIPTESLYQSHMLEEILGRLEYAAKRQLFAVVTGDSGRLFGGVGHDIFRLMDGAELNGSIDGGGGINTLDYSAYTTPVEVELASFTASHISLGIVGIQNVYGGQADDLLIGDNGDNILSGGGGNDRLIGGLGDDTYLFGDNFGSDTVIDTAGSNTLDFSPVTANLDFDTGRYQISDGINLLVYASTDEGFVSLIAKFIGGTGNDVFILDPDHELPDGTLIDGGFGSDTLVFSPNISNHRNIQGFNKSGIHQESADSFLF
jgi:Ca2+-binding RTX toxin-like protein